jgi:signal-transduction protein with cAMP-binding, CBS, and nucleotidyltransferase domain
MLLVGHRAASSQLLAGGPPVYAARASAGIRATGRALCCADDATVRRATEEGEMATHTDQKLELLKRVPLLAGLSGHDIEEVGRLAEEIDVPAGQVLMREGATGDEFFVIVSGSVRLDRGGHAFRTMGPGDFLGEIALVGDTPRTASGTTETPAKLLVVGHREFHSLMERFPTIQKAILQALAARVLNHEPDQAH